MRRAPDPGVDHRPPSDDDELEHQRLAAAADRARIAWAATSEGTEPTKRAKRALRDQCRGYAGLAVAKLLDLITRGDTGAVQLAAVKELLDRGFGRATEHVEIDARADESDLLARRFAELARRPETAAALRTLAEAQAAVLATPERPD